MKQGIEQQLPWFSADFSGRELSAPERDFIKALSAMLDRVRPPQVAPANTNLTAEGHGCLIAIIPHSLLAGVSIVVWQDLEGFSVCWAQIGDLSYHDDLDLGHCVGRFVKKVPVEVWHGETVRCVEEQLHRPIELRVSRTCGTSQPYVEFFLTDGEGKRLRLGADGKRTSLPLRFLAVDSDEEHHVVRFTDSDTPPHVHPVDIAAWYGSQRENGA
jgi:hypothetical protein